MSVPSPEWIAAEYARQDAEKAKGSVADQIAAAEQRGREEAWNEGVDAAFRGAISRQNAEDVKRLNPYRPGLLEMPDA